LEEYLYTKTAIYIITLSYKMIIKLKVIPNAKEERIEKLSVGEYKIKVKEKAVRGKANRRVAEILAKYFDVPVRNIKIKGLKTQKKIVEITGFNF